MNRNELAVVEPRFEDGTLNVKDPNNCFGTFKASGSTEDELFRFYFKNHPNTDGATWEQLREYFKTLGWYIRAKTW